MQNFSNSPAPPPIPSGFSGRGVGGASFPPQPAEPQISPRMTDDYVGMQQQSMHRGHHHPSQASHMLAYGTRNRGVLEPQALQGNAHSGNTNNPYRKEAMESYLFMGGKDRQRRTGMGYGAGFGFPNLDGHLPHQYRHPGSSSGPSCGLMSPYPVDYGSSGGSGGGAGAFSPSHQYSINQNPAMQPVPSSHMQPRHHGQSFSAVQHAQQHRSYPQLSGHRITPQYPNYSPQGGGSTGSSGMYSPPPQRFLDGVATTGFDPKVNTSQSGNTSSNSTSSSVAANNVGTLEGVQQIYQASNYPSYPPQSHSFHTQATLQQRNSQHSLGVAYDASLKMPIQGPSSGSVYTKHPQPSNASMPSSQEVDKSPMHPNAQQTQINQNFSPISNPSPVASAVHSPSCSSSPSPLMGVSEPKGNPSSGHGPSNPPTSSSRSSHGRLLQTAPQLSPTPNSNSSISSCGSSGSQKAHTIGTLTPLGRHKIGLGVGLGPREEGSSVYLTSSLEKMQDAGLNCLNALSSQVANLPNTVQHMLLTDTVLSHKKREGGQMQQLTHGLPTAQPRTRNTNSLSAGAHKDGNTGRMDDCAGLDVGADDDPSLMPMCRPARTKVDQEEQLSEEEHEKRTRQMSGASSESEATGYNQTQTGQASNLKSVSSDKQAKEAAGTETKAKVAHIPSPLSSSSEFPPVLSPSIPPTVKKNHVPEIGLTSSDHRGRKVKKESEAIVGRPQAVSCQMQQDEEASTKNSQNKENMLHSESKTHKKKEGSPPSEAHQNVSGVGVIVTARTEESRTEKGKSHRENCVEENRSHSDLQNTSSHNGEEGVDLSLYSQHQQKSNCGRSDNPPQSRYPESTHGSDLTMKNRVRASSAMETNPKYLRYQQSQANYSPVLSKDSGSAAETKRVHGAGSKSQEESAHMQQFPSLLQEVLQGYNLDRRYSRAEQAFSGHHQIQQQFPTRNSFSMGEGMRMHGALPEVSAYPTHMDISGNPPNQKHGSVSELSPVKSEMSSANVPQNVEKPEGSVPQSLSAHSIKSQQTPAKHINLSDYSLPRKKTVSNMSSASAVQELLLQDAAPLTASTGQGESQKSAGSTLTLSERRSVICDVSPNRRSLPEQDREGDRERKREKSHSGASVIQQQFSSPESPSDLSRKETRGKQLMKMETPSKELGNSIGMLNEAGMEYCSKALNPSRGVNADPYRPGINDVNSVPSHPIGTKTLTSPSRHQSYLHGVDLSSGGSTFPGYRYGETRESGMMQRSNTHFPSHHSFHHLPPQATNKLQVYPRGPPHPPHDISDWMKAMNRPAKEMVLQQGSPGRHKLNQSEKRHLPVEHHASKTPLLHHQNPYYDMKMWESGHPGREATRTMEGDLYYRSQCSPGPPLLPSPASLASHGHVITQKPPGPNTAEPEASRGLSEEPKPPCPPPPSPSKPPAESNSNQASVQRQTKTGGSGDTNPLMLRRRVRSFISPIPAKRLHHDASQQKAAANSHHSPGAQSDHSHHNEDDSSHAEMPCPRHSSPQPGDNSFIQPLSPTNAKVLATRKGRGLKLEAIVQKITPNIKKSTSHADDESNHYPSFSHSDTPAFTDSQDQDLAHFTRVTGGEDSYMDESHPLNHMIPFRGVDETGPLPPSSYPCDSHQTSQGKQRDFDFGLGAAVASGNGDKEDFALLGPLPPPPPLPRPVPGSPPPSSSALSDIQQFTNTYQELETRRGEQSAANLLRQKLQESGMGFEDYPGSDFYGTTATHQGHMLNRQHQMSGRSSLSPQDSKALESIVPKGYFPSGKKKGRPVGSVNKQKRVQSQVQSPAQTQVQTQSTTLSVPPAPLTPTPAADSTPPAAPTTSITPPTLTENISASPTAPPVLTQVVKEDAETEETQPEMTPKPVRRRRGGRRGEGEALEARGRQRRRRRGAVAVTPLLAKEDLEAPLSTEGTFCAMKGFADVNRKGLFIPHIHVEKKVPEIGAVCTIVNAEEDKMKGERVAASGKAGASGIDSPLTSALFPQLSRTDREAEKRETDEVETILQSGKALPSSGYVVSGPVITETSHSGRLLCCLCQKWANYKNLGDLYGPYYPAEYAARLPKNQPQIRQCQANAGMNKSGPSSDSNVLNSLHVTQSRLALLDHLNSNAGSYNRMVSSAGTEELMTHLSDNLSNTTSSSCSSTLKAPLVWEEYLDTRPLPELKREPGIESDLQPVHVKLLQLTDDTQQRPQHRKLTSHPRFKRRHKSSEDSPRIVASNSKASLPFQPPPPALDSLGPLAQLAQLPQMPMDPEELWVHEGCIVWTSGVHLVNGRLYGLQEALDGAREISCSHCEMVGSTLGCYTKGCTLRYHYLCAIEADCSLNEDNFSLRCPKHKFTQSVRPAKSVCLEQSERG